MGIYPNCELSLDYLESPQNVLSYEINQSKPRLIKNNLRFHNIISVHAGYHNSALLTEEGDVLLQGNNQFG
jgi:hypothetical protein